MVKDFEDLEIYQLSLSLAKRIYLITANFPKSELYGLVDQIRRSSASVGANIAEGFGRYHYKDKTVFYYNSRGSLYETKHFIYLANKLGYINDETKISLCSEIEALGVKLNNFIYSVGKTINDNK